LIWLGFIGTVAAIVALFFSISQGFLGEMPNMKDIEKLNSFMDYNGLEFSELKEKEAFDKVVFELGMSSEKITRYMNTYIKDEVYGSDYSAITLGVNIPIFSGFGTRAKIRQAQIESQALEATLKDTRLAMDLAYENARSQLTNNLLTIDSQKENVKLAEEVLLNTQNNYRQGLASLTDLLEAERSLSDAKNNYTTALLDYKLAEIELLKSQGKLETMK